MKNKENKMYFPKKGYKKLRNGTYLSWTNKDLNGNYITVTITK